MWQRDHRDFRAIQPDAGFYNDVSLPAGGVAAPTLCYTQHTCHTGAPAHSTRLLCSTALFAQHEFGFT